MSNAAARRLTHRSDVHDANVGDLAVEWHVAAPADDDVARSVAEQRDDLVVGHVEAERFARVRGRTVNHQHAVTRFERKVGARRELAEPRDDELAELLVHLLESIDPRSLACACRCQFSWIDLSESAVADALNAERSVIDQELPNLERVGTRKTQISAGDELIPAEVIGLLQHGSKRPRVAVNVGYTEKTHERPGAPGVQPLRQDC